jgi:DNA (cytosine-5)-methyltransferase 1
MNRKKLKFIDMFCGIGGFHIAFHELGLKCVAACDNDLKARKTYQHNFSEISPELFKKGFFFSNAEKIEGPELPDFDLLCAGFPCQPFSQAGYKRGFADKGRGTLFFDIARIVNGKRPAALFLENVRGIVKHDEGRTIATIRTIIDELGYTFDMKIVKASDYGLPQHRPRAFMICFDKNKLKEGAPSFEFPEKHEHLKLNMSDVWMGECDRDIGFTLRCGGRRSGVDDKRNWDGYRVNGEVRYLGPLEGKRMMGFPEKFAFPVLDVDAMRQLGNSVAVDAIREVGKHVVTYMRRNLF